MIEKFKLKKAALIIPFALFVGACGVDMGIGPHPSLRQPDVANVNVNNSEKMASLPPREMAKGECAVFLWSEESARPLVYVQNIATDYSTMLIDNQSVDLGREQASDMVIPGFFARQNFKSDNMELSVRLKPEQGRNLYEGIKIPSGILTVKKEDHSQNIVAVSGLLGCNLES